MKGIPETCRAHTIRYLRVFFFFFPFNKSVTIQQFVTKHSIWRQLLVNSCEASFKPNVKSLFIRPVRYTRQITWPLCSIIDFIKINTTGGTSGAGFFFSPDYLRAPKQKSHVKVVRLII